MLWSCLILLCIESGWSRWRRRLLCRLFCDDRDKQCRRVIRVLIKDLGLCPGRAAQVLLLKSNSASVNSRYRCFWFGVWESFAGSFAFDQSRLSGKSASASASTESLLPCFGAKLGGTSLSALVAPRPRPYRSLNRRREDLQNRVRTCAPNLSKQNAFYSVVWLIPGSVCHLHIETSSCVVRVVRELYYRGKEA